MIVLVFLIVSLRELLVSTIFRMVHVHVRTSLHHHSFISTLVCLYSVAHLAMLWPIMSSIHTCIYVYYAFAYTCAQFSAGISKSRTD